MRQGTIPICLVGNLGSALGVVQAWTLGASKLNAPSSHTAVASWQAMPPSGSQRKEPHRDMVQGRLAGKPVEPPPGSGRVHDSDNFLC